MVASIDIHHQKFDLGYSGLTHVRSTGVLLMPNHKLCHARVTSLFSRVAILGAQPWLLDDYHIIHPFLETRLSPACLHVSVSLMKYDLEHRSLFQHLVQLRNQARQKIEVLYNDVLSWER